jgi:hypothetical protein
MPGYFYDDNVEKVKGENDGDLISVLPLTPSRGGYLPNSI